jgi:hypothetical protein
LAVGKALAGEPYATARAEGVVLTLDQALAYALDEA